jgi:glutathione synthase
VYKVLIVADPLDALLVEMDSTLLIIQEMLDRDEEFEVHYCDYAKLNLDQNSESFLASIPCAKVLHCNVSDSNFIGLGLKQNISARDFDCILLRQDPPVDERFDSCCKLFAPIQGEVLFVNSPEWISTLKEHIIPTEYPDFSIPTTVCRSFSELCEAVKRQSPEAVIKPENECSGIGVVFVDPQSSAEVLKKYYAEYGPTVIVQPYLEEITKSGDLRVLVMNTKILGSVLRVPKKGSRLANFHQGGSGVAHEPSERQIEIATNVAKDLVKKGIYLVGFDFIGDQLSEVNITSPTGMAQINNLNGTCLQKDFVDEMLKLLAKS